MCTLRSLYDSSRCFRINVVGRPLFDSIHLLVIAAALAVAFTLTMTGFTTWPVVAGASLAAAVLGALLLSPEERRIVRSLARFG